MNPIIDKINKANLKAEAPAFNVGDTVEVHAKIKEGSKERIQVFKGTVIARDGSSSTETFTVRKISFNGEGVEKVFPLHSPAVDKVVVTRMGKTRRAKLYYVRNLAGKKARITERRTDGKKEEATEAPEAPEEATPVEPEASTETDASTNQD